MITFALDTNIISFYLRDNEKVIRNFEKAVESKSTILIAPFAYYEVRRGLLASKAARQLKEFDKMCAQYKVGQLDNAILNPASEIYPALRTKGWTIDEIDILIAAYCKSNGCTLVTNNTRHFAHIPGLALADWSAA
jgi:predicted nucleic acid-binding protein